MYIFWRRRRQPNIGLSWELRPRSGWRTFCAIFPQKVWQRSDSAWSSC